MTQEKTLCGAAQGNQHSKVYVAVAVVYQKFINPRTVQVEFRGYLSLSSKTGTLPDRISLQHGTGNIQLQGTMLI